MNTSDTPAIVRWTRRLEETTALDGAVEMMRPKVRSLFGSGPRGAFFRGEWLGHAVHPPMTDLVIGTWTSATLLDLFGGRDASGAAQRLVAMGLMAAGPTAWTGWAEWSELEMRDKRVGLVHAVSNGAAIGMYAASWLARRRGQHGRGVRLALAGASVSGAAAYLGGHLVAARKVSSHHSAFDESEPALA